jgi:hypothetical protein
MMARRTFGRGVLGILVASTAALLPGCNPFGNSGSYRYRMTVEVQTTGGLRTGGGVREVGMSKSVALTAQERPYGGGETGEAVVVDLPAGPVFLLLRKADEMGQPLSVEVTNALNGGDAGLGEERIAVIRRLGSETGVKAELPRAAWPMMVRFRDINDPKSVEKVDPAAIGVKRIVLETTDDAVTTGIEKRLAWLDALEQSSANSVVETSASSIVGQLRKK